MNVFFAHNFPLCSPKRFSRVYPCFTTGFVALMRQLGPLPSGPISPELPIETKSTPLSFFQLRVRSVFDAVFSPA